MASLNFFAVSSICIVVSNLTMGIILLVKGRGERNPLMFACLCFSVAIWGVGGLGFSTASSKEAALFWWQIGYICVLFIPVIYYHFIYTFFKLGEEHPKYKFILISSYALELVFLALTFFARDMFLGDARFVFGQYYHLDWLKNRSVIWMVFWISQWWILLSYSFLLLIFGFIRSSGIRRTQMKYLLAGSVVGWIGGHSIFPPYFHLDIYPYANILIAFYTIIMGIGIVKYHLMDIRVVITRIGLFAGIYTLLLGVPFYIGYRTDKWILSAGVLAVFATIGPVIYRYLQRKADEIFFKKSRQYQKIILEASEDILAFKDKDTLLEKISSLIFENVLPSLVAIYLLEKKEYVLKISKPQEVALPAKLGIDHPLLERFKVEERAALDITVDDASVSLALPIGKKEEITGVFLLGEKEDKAHYSLEDVETFRALLNQTSLALENILHIQETVEEQKEKERLKKEMELAQQIQKSLLPRISPETEGCRIEGVLLPAKEVAGDYYDFIEYSPQKLGIVVADVSGKGLDSGMVMSMTKSTISPLAEQGLSCRELVIKLNRHLCKQLQHQKFISLIYAEYTSADSKFTWAGAGHERVIVYRAKEKPEVEVIKTGGIVLGMFDDVDDKISQETVTLNSGDRIVLYSDGVTEARNPDNNMFSLERLVKTVQGAPSLAVGDFLDYIQGEIKKFMAGAPQYDDITLVVLGRE